MSDAVGIVRRMENNGMREAPIFPVRTRDDTPSWATLGSIAVLQASVAYLMLVGVPLTIVHLGGGAVLVGLSFTAWAAGRSVMGYWSGRNYDRVGARAGLVASFVVFAAASALYGAAATPWLLVLARLCQGIGAGMYWAAILAVAGGTQSGAPRMRRLSLFNALVAAGGILGSVTGGWLMALGMARVMELAVLLSLILVVLAATKIPSRVPTAERTPLLPLGGIMKTPVGTVSALAALSQVPILFASAGLPLILLSVGLGAEAIGVENALIVGGTLVGQVMLFRLSQWAVSRQALYALYLLMTAALLALAVSRAPVVIMGALALIGLAAALLATLWTSAVQSAVPHHHIGGATGFMRASSDLVLGATYPLVGLADAYVPEAAGAMILLLGASVAIIGAGKVPLWATRPRRLAPSAASPAELPPPAAKAKLPRTTGRPK